jgi:hypothetical protein
MKTNDEYFDGQNLLGLVLLVVALSLVFYISFLKTNFADKRVVIGSLSQSYPTPVKKHHSQRSAMPMMCILWSNRFRFKQDIDDLRIVPPKK